MKQNSTGGGAAAPLYRVYALRAKEIGPLKRLRSGARVWQAGLFVCDRKTQEELKMKFNVKKLVVSGMLTALAVALSTFSVPIGRRNVSRFSTW